MPDYKITLKCRAGHVQTIVMRNTGRVLAEGFASIMDGTSPIYAVDPREGEHESGWIGHCQEGRTGADDEPPFTVADAKAQGACAELYTASVQELTDTELVN